MGNCLNTSTSADISESESPSSELSSETIPSLDENLLRDLPAAPQSMTEFDIAQRFRCPHCFPVSEYVSGEAAAGKTKDCAICLLDFVDGDRIRALPCKHVFHLDCIGKWLMTSFTCPCCRLSV
ncbi:RING finger protein 11-like [Sorex fumeus]|uniref:RING finger protein 11-like n=1 Tax=Sorex fumeus TaxID=62283 RepID=UPI0024ACF2DC|nr:RING finger protein 11-like [Sorex fumeus]